jgi:uncharacterized protein (TIGR02421 family)
MDLSDRELDRLTAAAALILDAERQLPVLGSVAWDREVADAFFASGARALPRPVYRPVDPAPYLEAAAAARALVAGASPVHAWLHRLCDMVETTARMLASLGTAGFTAHSAALYGTPQTPVADGATRALDLARRLDALLSDIDAGSGYFEPAQSFDAHELKRRLDALLPEHFPDALPAVDISRRVSAKAVAGKGYIRLREDARFTETDVVQLLQHEALIHIATGLNGAAQTRFPILGESHPGNARTQEGLAVFAEFISGALDPRRFRRLADRVIAIDMALEGADFLDLYRFFLDKNPHDAPIEAFESARRVVRGGLVEGGAPFTKDNVYLSGLIEVHSYLRAAVRSGDPRHIRLLFAGKLDIADLSALAMLDDQGLLVAPRYLPPWARDMRFLLSYLAYSTFLNQIDLSRVQDRHAALLAPVPRGA